MKVNIIIMLLIIRDLSTGQSRSCHHQNRTNEVFPYQWSLWFGSLSLFIA